MALRPGISNPGSGILRSQNRLRETPRPGPGIPRPQYGIRNLPCNPQHLPRHRHVCQGRESDPSPRRPSSTRSSASISLDSSRGLKPTAPGPHSRVSWSGSCAILECGLLCFGFCRVDCSTCKKDELVAFRCKKRGFCPSCGARRVAETAAHLVDHVLPDVPSRPWVLSLPYRIRFLCPDDQLCASAMRRILTHTISRH